MGRFYTGDIEGKFWFGIQTHPIINKINDDFVYSESKKKEVAMLVARYTLGYQIEYCLSCCLV